MHRLSRTPHSFPPQQYLRQRDFEQVLGSSSEIEFAEQLREWNRVVGVGSDLRGFAFGRFIPAFVRGFLLGGFGSQHRGQGLTALLSKL